MLSGLFMLCDVLCTGLYISTRFHGNSRKRKWRKCGYMYIVFKDTAFGCKKRMAKKEYNLLTPQITDQAFGSDETKYMYTHMNRLNMGKDA